MSEASDMERILGLARADDPALAEELAAFTDPELVGELMVAVYRSATPAARAGLRPLLTNDAFRRGYWQGFKRIYKLAEAELDAEFWVHTSAVLAQRYATRTVAYLQRRSYRHLKQLAWRHPERFWEHAAGLLRALERETPLAARVPATAMCASAATCSSSS